MRLILCHVLLLVIVLGWLAAGAEARERYILRSRAVTGRSEKYVWLYDAARNKILWKRHLNDWMTVHWSRDHRALAVECQAMGDKGGSETGVIVWREGYQLRFFRTPGRHDYPMGCVWSPDNCRLLIRAGGSEASTADYGELFCMQLGNWPNYKIFRVGDAARMTWKGNKTVVFWERNYLVPDINLDYDETRKSRLWRDERRLWQCID